MTTPSNGRLAILVGGGPAPGINSVISSVTIEAINEGLEVLGIFDGFQHLIAGTMEEPGQASDLLDGMRVCTLSIPDVSSIHFQGGSVLRTSRANPTQRPGDLATVVASLDKLGITYLVTIGGDGTSYTASEVARAAGGRIRVAHVPKTIDNDLPLPVGMPTFGFETARHVGTQSVLNIMEDSRTTNRWYFVVVMGRTAGHLALGIGKASGATLTLVPEEFGPDTPLAEVARHLEGAILKRRVMGRNRGVAIIAEGISGVIDPQELASASGVPVEYDPYGAVRLAEVPLAMILRRQVQQHFAARGEPISIVDTTLGYELRSAQPIPFDIDYTRSLGHGAVGFLLSRPHDESLRNGGLVCLDRGNLRALPFDSLRDGDKGRNRVRLVDLASEHYISARQYMIRLDTDDFIEPDRLDSLAEAAHVTRNEFLRDFGPTVISSGEAESEEIAV